MSTATVMAPGGLHAAPARTDWLKLMPSEPMKPSDFLVRLYAWTHKYSPGDVVGIEVVRPLAAALLQAWAERDKLQAERDEFHQVAAKLPRETDVRGELELVVEIIRQSNTAGQLLVDAAFDVARQKIAAAEARHL